MLLPDIDYVEIPVDWWNAEADKSLLIGVFKHGVYPAVWWVLVCGGMSTSGTGEDVMSVRGPEPWPCSTATQGQESSPQVPAACLGGEQAPRGAQGGRARSHGRLWFAGAVCSCCVRAGRKAQIFSWPWSWSPGAVSRRHRAVCPSCTLPGGCAAAGWDGKADLSLCLLPRGCRAISSLCESVVNFWG